MPGGRLGSAMSRLSLLLVLATGCHDVYLTPSNADLAERAQFGTCEPWGGTYSGVVFSDEQAQNTIDFVDHATAKELEILIGIGPSIAGKVVAARPYADQADPLAALDAVPYVGPMLLNRLRADSYDLWCGLDDGRQSCCVELACEGLGGTFGEVEFGDAEAQMVLDWANRADTDELISVCGVGPTIAGGIEAARPLHSIDELDAVLWVGPSVMRRMLAEPGARCFTEPGVAELWCGIDDAACACDDAPVVEPVPSEDKTHDTVDTLPGDVREVLSMYLWSADLCGEAQSSNPVFGSAVEHVSQGVTTGWTFDLSQLLDTEGAQTIFVHLDANLQQTDLFCDL